MLCLINALGNEKKKEEEKYCSRIYSEFAVMLNIAYQV